MRRVVGSRELKTRLGTYLRAVRGGATLVVTERGAPVAELRPLPVERTDVAAGLAHLEAQGLLTRGQGGPLPTFEPLRARGRRVSATLVDDRDERF